MCQLLLQHEVQPLTHLRSPSPPPGWDKEGLEEVPEVLQSGWRWQVPQRRKCVGCVHACVVWGCPCRCAHVWERARGPVSLQGCVCPSELLGAIPAVPPAAGPGHPAQLGPLPPPAPRLLQSRFNLMLLPARQGESPPPARCSLGSLFMPAINYLRDRSPLS